MTPKKGSIFIQIVSYRDPEIRNTLKDLLENAYNPDRLKICIAWQNNKKDLVDNIEDYKKDPRFKILDIDYKKAKGVCWARNLIQQEYNGEDYTLQLDSHHRFIKNWDKELIEMLIQLQDKGHNKPLITGYIPSYNPEKDPEDRVQVPWKMNFDRFTPEGVVFFLPATIENHEKLTEPIPSRFYSAHFAFTLGKFCKEVQHDPDYYFHGEEIAIAVRAFTSGYDLFHPHKIIAWHEYTRNNRVKQWDDDPIWHERNQKTFYRLRGLLGTDGKVCSPCMLKTLKPYILGEERTLKDYEKYAGIRFSDRGVQKYTTDNKLPPNPPADEYRNPYQNSFRHCIDIHKNDLQEKDYDFWAIIFQDAAGHELFRKDADKKEIEILLNNDTDWVNIWREYNGIPAYKWIFWPHSASKGWLTPIEEIIGLK